MSNILKRVSLATEILAISLPFSLPAEAIPDLYRGISHRYSAQKINDIDHNWVDSSNNSLQSAENNEQDSFMSQVNDVDRLRDVSSVDWAYEALVNLASRYGCITGFPNNTYRGNQVVSRYEFAAGLNSCLNTLEKAISASEEVATDDLEILLRLMQDFQAELAILRGKTDGLQARITELELTQFSTTTKLSGEVIFGLGSVFAGETDKSTVLGDRVRLNLNTSFNGEDLLFTRLATGNLPSLSSDTGFQGELSFTQPEDNDLQLEVLYYTFPVSNNTEVIIGATGTAADDLVNTVTILDGDGASGAISRFGTRNPIYLSPADAGLGITYNLGNTIEISGGYLAFPTNQPTEGSGIFDAPYSAIAQIFLNPSDSLDVAFTYVHSRNQSDTETGSNKANIQSFTANNAFPDGVSTVSDSYGIELSWTISDRFIIGGWGTLSKVTTLSTLGGSLDRGTQDIWNTALTVALPDLGKEGNMAGIIVGIEPTVTNSSIDNLAEDEDLSLHVEAFYQYQVNDYIAVTPGVVWITAPDNDTNNEDLVIGTIRTTFSF
ncbi:Porin type major outer membrane protein [Hyella patelloides LEGE 07179]|uniref:Porin type major outer membrane protein n=1 Tax=Hyella patelloides LEGE 07179 TaxID=945734 RepID=A0A563W3V0_9CYAN|nr:iron uptake porin [Hyella patelloides]VEP18354.1 Porin type major outer membrane protein [Hyella patelloides LEGE 07179]